MKKQLQTSVLTLLACAGSVALSAQAITENFSPNPQAIFSNGWAQQNLSTPVGTTAWFNGNATVFPSYSGNDSTYIGANFNAVTGANTISEWLFAPNRTFNNGDIISFYTRTVDTPTYPDRLEVRLSTNGASVNAGATNTSVGDFTTLLLTINSGLTTGGYPNTWTQYTITMTGLAGPTSGRVAFRYFVTNGGPSGSNSDYIGIDNFQYTPAGTPDVMVDPYMDEYTLIPVQQVTAFNLSDTIRNGGAATANNTMLTVNIYEYPNFITPLQTTTSATATLAVGAAQLFSAGSFTPADTGFFVFEFISTCTNNSVNANDTAYYGVTVTDSTYARDDGLITAALGIGAGNGGYLGNSFEIVNPTFLTTVLTAYALGYTGEPYAAVVWNTVAGVPNAIIGSTDTLLYPNDSLLVTTVPIHGGPLLLMPGIYVVTVTEFDSTVQVAQTTDIFTPGTTWIDWPTSPQGGWAPIEDFNISSFNHPFVIRPNFNCTTSATQNVTVCAGGSVTVGSNTYNASGTYNDTLTNAFGCDSIVVTNLTVDAPIDVTTTTNTYVITATQMGATYQWIDCNNGNAPIVGETNQSYTATADGSYAVIVTVGACSDTSACEVIIGMGISSASSEGAVSLYPNPNNGAFVVTSTQDGQFTIVNQLGQEVKKFELNQANNFRASFEDLGAGVYIMSGYSNGKFVSQRFVVNEN